MNNLVNSLPSKIILIVDDNPNNLQLLFQYLKKVGYKILIAQSGNKAIETAKANHPDLILLDVMMSNLDGFATCRYLKSNPSTKDIPVIFMTALKETENKVQGFKLGAVDYITKPIKEEELLARIETHLSLQSLRQNLAQDAAQQKLLGEISDRIRQSLDLKLILETATKEIRALLDCDLVWLAQINNQTQINNQSISIKAYASSGITIDFEENIPYDYFLLNTNNHQHICYTNSVDGNIPYSKCDLQNKIHKIEVNKTENRKQKTEILLDAQSLLNPKARLIAPILINPTQSADPSTVKNTLWGWLIADQYKSSRQWQIREIDLLEKLTTQLAIGIKQGLLYQQLSKLAIVDSLTNLYNRRYFDQQLYKEWYRLKRASSPLSLIICDVDCFKKYNDTYGHQLGDECLQQVAKAIASTIKRPGDVLTRYGGEEFAAILPHTPESGAIKVAEDMRIAVRELNIPHLDSSTNSVVTISVGIASVIPTSENNPDLLLKAADLSLYQSKERGRDCITVYSDPISTFKERQEKTKCWVKHLRQALQENLFSLYAQPIVPLEVDDKKRYFEILLRLTDKSNGVISPNIFLDIAERNSLITDIDTWVVNNLMEKLSNFHSEGESSGTNFDLQDYRFSINLSGASLNSESFLEFLSQKLTDSHLPPDLFCFEITETVAVSNLTRVSKFINSLKNLGCSFALDDFGKGMSSLTYLKNLPVDYLKIDGSFIKELNSNKASRVMVEAINHIAEGIGLKTIAEFVENQTILDALRKLKVDYVQGFHLGRPGILMDVLSHPVSSNP
ncbi:EAL domain-containing response regulator [Mastigocoleus testarum]|uniref:Diguanylate cyclase n=1 Tax=Mastigocoleus testarum BC008 TaxID=371196 RepID=A0A0V7ZZ03_9CYAN|nr:EAL domain-containing response regulator [Mastigocoleus testarum]KST67553.1 hypothetical protein BC008_30625 [Mastigocoleus testarum BC008]KST69811.1 hypothetical protein BC008_36225 [Mastigocoleus testarum BC008]